VRWGLKAEREADQGKRSSRGGGSKKIGARSKMTEELIVTRVRLMCRMGKLMRVYE